MTDSDSDFSIEALTLPHEDPLEHLQLFGEWMTPYAYSTPIERSLIRQAVVALIEKRRCERIRAVLRADRVRTAVLFWERQEEDMVAHYLNQFNVDCPSALVGLTRSAAGCRWAIGYWVLLQRRLAEEGTWYGENRIGVIQLQGLSSRLDELYCNVQAFRTWVDCLVTQPNPKQKEIDKILDPRNIPPAFQERNEKFWPGNPAESRARLQALVDRELPRLRALELTLRVQYEDPERAEAKDMALASVTWEETALLRAECTHEQSYLRAVTALLKLRKQAVALRPLAAGEINESWLMHNPVGRWGVVPGAWCVGKNRETPAVSPTWSSPRRTPAP